MLTLATGVTSPTGAGTLTLDSANSKLALFYVNGYNPTTDTMWQILNYGDISGTFDLANNLLITGATGAAADASNYSVTYNGTNAVLALTVPGGVPEPTSIALLGLAGVGLLRRRNRSA